MTIPAEAVAESQTAYRQIRRYRKSASPWLWLLILAAPLLVHHTPPAPPIPKIWYFLAIMLFALVQIYQRRGLHRKSEEARKRLDRLRNNYGSEIDAVARQGRVAWTGSGS